MKTSVSSLLHIWNHIMMPKYSVQIQVHHYKKLFCFASFPEVLTKQLDAPCCFLTWPTGNMYFLKWEKEDRSRNTHPREIHFKLLKRTHSSALCWPSKQCYTKTPHASLCQMNHFKLNIHSITVLETPDKQSHTLKAMIKWRAHGKHTYL